jgi:8-oxo-dGTP pyrophosphatase MutT (NUDIX family)
MSNKNEKIVYEGKMIEVVQESVEKNGQAVLYERARRAPGVRLIIRTPKGNFLISKERRHGLKEIDYRLPGGKVFDSLSDYKDFLKSGEDIKSKTEEAVKREGIEEAGIEPLQMEHYVTSACGGSLEWDLYYFVVNTYKEVGQQLEIHEEIETVEVSSEELKELALSGKMQEDRSVAVILKYLHNKL